MKAGKRISISLLLIFAAVSASAQARDGTSTLFRLQDGVDYFSFGMWEEAREELRFVVEETHSPAQRAEALFWLGMTELSLRDFAAAVHSFETLELFDPENPRMADVWYQKGRALFGLGRFEESIIEISKYIATLPVNESGFMNNETSLLFSSALYWIGESLFSMGHLDRAEEIFLLVVEDYPNSFKFEASFYRVALIAQKRVESELLQLLGWTHEESLRTMEEYKRREHAYEQALIAYQRRIADMLRDSRLSELENENAFFRQQIATSDERIRNLENELRIVQTVDTSSGRTAVAEEQAAQPSSRLSNMRSLALDLLNHIEEAEEH